MGGIERVDGPGGEGRDVARLCAEAEGLRRRPRTTRKGQTAGLFA